MRVLTPPQERNDALATHNLKRYGCVSQVSSRLIEKWIWNRLSVSSIKWMDGMNKRYDHMLKSMCENAHIIYCPRSNDDEFYVQHSKSKKVLHAHHQLLFVIRQWTEQSHITVPFAFHIPLLWWCWFVRWSLHLLSCTTRKRHNFGVHYCAVILYVLSFETKKVVNFTKSQRNCKQKCQIFADILPQCREAPTRGAIVIGRHRYIPMCISHFAYVSHFVPPCVFLWCAYQIIGGHIHLSANRHDICPIVDWHTVDNVVLRWYHFGIPNGEQCMQIFRNENSSHSFHLLKTFHRQFYKSVIALLLSIVDFILHIVDRIISRRHCIAISWDKNAAKLVK